MAHDVDDLVAFVLRERLKIVAVNLDREFAFYAADRFLHVVCDGLREVPDDAGNFLQLVDPWRRSALPCLSWKTGRHCSFGFKIDEVFGVEEAGRVGAVIGAAYLA